MCPPHPVRESLGQARHLTHPMYRARGPRLLASSILTRPTPRIHRTNGLDTCGSRWAAQVGLVLLGGREVGESRDGVVAVDRLRVAADVDTAADAGAAVD